MELARQLAMADEFITELSQRADPAGPSRLVVVPMSAGAEAKVPMGGSGPEVTLGEPGKWRKVGANEPAPLGFQYDSPCCQVGKAGPQLFCVERQVGHLFN